MRVRAPLASFLLLANAALGGVPADIPELERRLAGAPAAERPALLIAIAEAAELSDVERAFAAAREARELARDPRQRLPALALVAAMTRDLPDYPESLRLAGEGLAEAAALGDIGWQARFHYILARTQWSRSDYPAAVASFHEAIRCGEQARDAPVLVDAHTGITVIYLEFRQLDNAQFHVEKAREFAARLSDPARAANFQRILGNYLQSSGDLPGARAAHERSRQISADAGHLRREADALLVLAGLDESERNYIVARDRNVAALALYEKLGLKVPATSAHRQLGVVLSRLGQITEALQHLETAGQLRRDAGLEEPALLYRDRAVVYEMAGNLKAALENQREAQVRNERFFGERTRQQLAVLTARAENERRQHEIDTLKREQALKASALALKDTELALTAAELARASWQRYTLLGVVFFGSLAAVALLSRQRLKLATEQRVHDETRAARKAAEDANRLKTRLLGIASHDLRSPLSTMISCAREIEQRPHDTTVAAELARGLEREGLRLLALVRDLLDVSAIEERRLTLKRAPCDLRTVVQESVDRHRPAAETKGQSLGCRMAAVAEVLVSADAARLAQVFDNLIGNAVKFTPPGQPIEVNVTCAGNRAVTSVRDSGPGLQPEDFTRLFQPFQTLSARPTGGEPSSGLGLFIAREIVTLHHGRVGVDSAPGEGTTFFVDLPTLAADEKSEARSSKSETS